jgi:nucleoside-diphosphate-sugar epimerase
MKIFVTGSAGFIGSNFIRHILGIGKNFAVVNYDKLTYAGNLANLESVADNPNYEFVKGDICDAAAVETAMRGCDAVIHFAAESHVDRSIYGPLHLQTNVTGTFMLWWRAESRFLFVVSLTGCMVGIPEPHSPMKLFLYNRTAHPRRRRVLGIFLRPHLRFRSSSRGLRTITVLISSPRNLCR